jgi:ribokinase
MFDIVTFGSATRDIFLESKTFKVVGEKKFLTGKGLCLALGSKIEVDDIISSTGGGGTNTAATFAKQGFETAFCGMLGDDQAGQDVLNDLDEIGVDINFVLRSKTKRTNQSVVLESPSSRERTIIVYRGASGELSKTDIPLEKLHTKWFYIAPLSGNLCKIFEYLVDYAVKHDIKVAVNPGNCQLKMPIKKLKKILKKIDVLFLNQEETCMLTKIAYNKEKHIFRKLDEMCPGIAVMTKGPEGVTVSDGKHLYCAPSPKVKVVDATGAGDSFASGFLSGLIQSNNNIEYAIQLGMANSASCIQKIGAKSGLLKKGQIFKKVKVLKEHCKENNLCLVKK